MDDIERLPRTPVEFSIATDSNGELELTDAKLLSHGCTQNKMLHMRWYVQQKTRC